MKQYSFSEYDIVKFSKKNLKGYYALILFLLIGIVILLFKFNFRIYIKYTMVKNDDNYAMIVDVSNIKLFENNSMLYIDGKNVNYQINRIDKEFNNINGAIYQTIYLNLIDFNSSAQFVDCLVLERDETIIESIIKFIRGGF